MYVAAELAIFGLCLAFVRRHWPQHKDPWSLADTIFSFGFFPFMTWFAMVATWSLHFDVELRWHGKTKESRLFCLLYVTRALMHVFVQCKQRISSLHFALMTLHHILSVVCFGGGLLCLSCQYWACFAGCCEMSTIFLNNVYILKEVTVGGKELRQLVPKWLYAVNGLGLWISYLIFRMVLFPVWLYTWYKDVQTWPGATWERATFVERYVYPGVLTFIFLLSLYWFVPVTKGLLKALGLMGRKDRKDE